MDKEINIVKQLSLKKSLEKSLEEIYYGSIEIREKNNNKYIYVHYRENGRKKSKYVGEYSEELYNLILKNNISVKEIKKELKEVKNKLKELGHIDYELSTKVKLNIDFAKRYLVDSIYQQAILEGVATTYADTENIIEGGKVNNMTSSDVLKIINLKHAWEFILSENVLASKSDLYILSEINKLVEEGFYYSAGNIRNTPVKIGGTNWKPEIPIESQIKEELIEIQEKEITDLEKAIEFTLYIMKKQIFLDGNKRTSIIFANHFLISKGLGIIIVSVDLIDEFKKLLIDYYENNKDTNIKNFLKKHCYIKLND